MQVLSDFEELGTDNEPIFGVELVWVGVNGDGVDALGGMQVLGFQLDVIPEREGEFVE